MIPLGLPCALISAHRLNSSFSGISQQNRHFNMFTNTSKWQEDSPCKTSHTKGFKTTNFVHFYCRKFIVICRSLLIYLTIVCQCDGVAIVLVSERDSEPRAFDVQQCFLNLKSFVLLFIYDMPV